MGLEYTVEDTSGFGGVYNTVSGLKSNPLLQDSVIDSADMFGSKALNTTLNDAVTNGISSKKVFGQLGNTAVSPTIENAAIRTATSNGFTPGMAPPAGLAMDDLLNQYSPEQIGQMNFDGVAGGTYGTDAIPGKDSGFFGIGNDNMKSAIGLGQLGLGVAGYFQNKGVFDAQKDLLKQQLSDARDESAAKKGVRRQLGAAYGG